MKIKKLVASIMAIATISTCAFAAVGCKEKETEKETAYTQQGGTVIMDGESNGISFMSTTIAQEDYDEYGVSATAESAVQLSVVVKDNLENVMTEENAPITWNVAFKNAASTWATGKTVTDYVTVTPTAQGAHTAVVQCLQAFGEQIIVKAAYSANVGIYATKNFDYEYRINGLSSLTIGEESASIAGSAMLSCMEVSDNVDISCEPKTTSAYTIDYSGFTISATVMIDERLARYLEDEGGFTLLNGGNVYVPLSCTGNLVANILNETDRALLSENDKNTYENFRDSLYAYLTDNDGNDVVGSVRIVMQGKNSTYTKDFEITLCHDCIVDEWANLNTVASVNIEGEDVIF